MDHHTSLLFTIWLAVELISVVGLYSTKAIEQNGMADGGQGQCNGGNMSNMTNYYSKSNQYRFSLIRQKMEPLISPKMNLMKTELIQSKD